MSLAMNAEASSSMRSSLKPWAPSMGRAWLASSRALSTSAATGSGAESGVSGSCLSMWAERAGGWVPTGRSGRSGCWLLTGLTSLLPRYPAAALHTQVGTLRLRAALAGKTTLFNALTRAGAPAGGAAGKANVAAVPVPDHRVDVLADLEHSRKRVFVQVRFVDVVAPGGGRGGGLSAQGLGALREADALAMVLAAFDGGDPAAAAADLNLELTVADLESIASGAEKAAKRAKAGGRAAEVERALQVPAVAVPAALEAEAAELEPAEAAEFLASYGVERGGLDQVVGAAWRLLDLQTFFTTGEDETRAWEVRRGATAPEAAGRIHSDLERGFIRAEVIAYDDLVAAGGWDAARAKGLLHAEGRSYVVQEADCLHIRFNV